MRKLNLIICLASSWALLGLSCEKEPDPEPPKIQNCIELKYLFFDCGVPYFLLKDSDTTKVKGDSFSNPTLYAGQKSNDRAVIGLFKDESLWAFIPKLKVGKTYFFEYRFPLKSEIYKQYITHNCRTFPDEFSQIVIQDTLTSKCTK